MTTRRTTVTVAVASVGRPQRLARSLDFIARQDDSPDGFIVISQERDFETQAVAQAEGAQLVVVRRPGAAHAIQQGIAAASTEVISFIDDDAEAHPDWVRRIRTTFDADSRLGLLGGRDNVDGDRDAGNSALPVGVVRRGRVIGNHHLGKGEARAAHHVKGANMSLRVSPARNIDVAGLVRGEGAQTAFELILSLGILRQGFSGRYDPRVQVDHFPAPRAKGDERTRHTFERTAIMKHNEATAVALYLPRHQVVVYVLRSLLRGDRICCGALTLVYLRLGGDTSAAQRFRASLVGLRSGLRTARVSRGK